MKRINFLDGFRGLAILMVLFFHAFSRWTAVVPYGDEFSAFPVFRYGFLGVQLFFLVSGFVILMTLEKNKTFLQYIYKRWLRLFPAMLIATILLFITAPFLAERPGGAPELNSVIPGLIFIQPSWIKFITGIDIVPLEGVFWSLYVEVIFYVIFGLLYFSFDKYKAILGISLLYIVSMFSENLFHIRYIGSISNALYLSQFGWFASGALVYLYYCNRQNKYLLYAVIIGLLQVLEFKDSIGTLLISAVILGIFLLPFRFEKLRFLLNNRFLLFIGFISYPLYLIHQNAMIAMIIKLHNMVPAIPGLLLPVIPVICLCIISYFIAKEAEPFVRRLIKKIAVFVTSKPVTPATPD